MYFATDARDSINANNLISRFQYNSKNNKMEGFLKQVNQGGILK